MSRFIHAIKLGLRVNLVFYITLFFSPRYFTSSSATISSTGFILMRILGRSF